MSSRAPGPCANLHLETITGYSWDMGRATSGAEVGAGVRYDFGRVHLEALDNALGVANQDQRVHQALVGVGSTFPWHGETEFCLSEFAEMQLAPAHFPGNVRT